MKVCSQIFSAPSGIDKTAKQSNKLAEDHESESGYDESESDIGESGSEYVPGG